MPAASYTIAVILEIDANDVLQGGSVVVAAAAAAAAAVVDRAIDAIVGGEYTGTPPGPKTPGERRGGRCGLAVKE